MACLARVKSSGVIFGGLAQRLPSFGAVFPQCFDIALGALVTRAMLVQRALVVEHISKHEDVNFSTAFSDMLFFNDVGQFITGNDFFKFVVTEGKREFCVLMILGASIDHLSDNRSSDFLSVFSVLQECHTDEFFRR